MPAAANPSVFAKAHDQVRGAVWGAPWAASLLFCIVCSGTVGHEPPQAWEDGTGTEKKPNPELSPQEARSLGLCPCHHEQTLACPRPLSVGPGARQPESGTASLCQLLNPLGQHRAGTLVRTCCTCGADRVDARMGCSLVLPQPCSECGQGLGWVLHGALSTWRPVPARCFHHFWQHRPQHHSLLLRLQQALVGWLETSIATEGPHHSLLPWAGIVLLYHVCFVPLPTVGGPVAPGAVETP